MKNSSGHEKRAVTDGDATTPTATAHHGALCVRSVEHDLTTNTTKRGLLTPFYTA